MTTPYRLNKEDRITRKSDFESIFSIGKRSDSSFFRAHYLLNRGAHKVAFAAPKRLGNAVVRNRAKRRLREAYRLTSPPVTSPFFVVLVAKSSILGVSFKSMMGAMSEVMGSVASEQSRQ